MADFNKIIIGPNFKDSLAEVQLMEKTDSLPRKDGVHGLFIAHGIENIISI